MENIKINKLEIDDEQTRKNVELLIHEIKSYFKVRGIKFEDVVSKIEIELAKEKKEEVNDQNKSYSLTKEDLMNSLNKKDEWYEDFKENFSDTNLVSLIENYAEYVYSFSLARDVVDYFGYVMSEYENSDVLHKLFVEFKCMTGNETMYLANRINEEKHNLGWHIEDLIPDLPDYVSY